MTSHGGRPAQGRPVRLAAAGQLEYLFEEHPELRHVAVAEQGLDNEEDRRARASRATEPQRCRAPGTAVAPRTRRRARDGAPADPSLGPTTRKSAGGRSRRRDRIAVAQQNLGRVPVDLTGFGSRRVRATVCPGARSVGPCPRFFLPARLRRSDLEDVSGCIEEDVEPCVEVVRPSHRPRRSTSTTSTSRSAAARSGPVDRDGGVDLDALTAATQAVSAALDAADGAAPTSGPARTASR